MIPYMVGKLTPNSSHLTWRLVKYVSGRVYLRVASFQNGDKFVTSPSPPNRVNGSSAYLIERVADKLIKSSNSCQGKRLRSVLVIEVHSESRTMITDRLVMGNHANEHSEAILPRKFQSSYSEKCCIIFKQ